jgi:hypothetical protein
MGPGLAAREAGRGGHGLGPPGRENQGWPRRGRPGFGQGQKGAPPGPPGTAPGASGRPGADDFSGARRRQGQDRRKRDGTDATSVVAPDCRTSWRPVGRDHGRRGARANPRPGPTKSPGPLTEKRVSGPRPRQAAKLRLDSLRYHHLRPLSTFLGRRVGASGPRQGPTQAMTWGRPGWRLADQGGNGPGLRSRARPGARRPVPASQPPTGSGLAGASPPAPPKTQHAAFRQTHWRQCGQKRAGPRFSGSPPPGRGPWPLPRPFW